MMKSLCLIILLVFLTQQQAITPYYVLPVQSTQNVATSYSFLFFTDTDIANNAWVAITFPFEFSPNALTQVTRVRYSTNGSQPVAAKWSINLYQFLIQMNQIAIGNITVVIDNVLNPKDYSTSSYFVVQTLFKNVVITSNTEFARVPFTPVPSNFFIIQP
jgi:hypothetical protein